MKGYISHDLKEESREAKLRWFHSLTPEERMRVFDEFISLFLAMNPRINERKDAQRIAQGVRIITKP